MEKKLKTIHELDLFESIQIPFSSADRHLESLKRVPGGWLHIIHTPNSSSTFIPFNRDFFSHKATFEVL